MSSARHVITRMLNPRFLSELASYDVASTVHLSLPFGYHLKRCLMHCREHNVVDAQAYLLERMGAVDEALALHINAYTSRLR